MEAAAQMRLFAAVDFWLSIDEVKTAMVLSCQRAGMPVLWRWNKFQATLCWLDCSKSAAIDWRYLQLFVGMGFSSMDCSTLKTL